MIAQRFRKDYAGEFVITQTSWAGGKKRSQREWLPNPIDNHHISGRAACIASVADGEHFDFKLLQRHKGGLLGSKKLQTYGTGELAKHMRLDFTVEKDAEAITQLVHKNYFKENIVYTTPRNCLKYPGVFYTIPYNPGMIQQVVLAYLAAFDGHTEIFLLGYHDDAGLGHNNWHNQMEQVIAAYPAATFYHVGYAPQTPSTWRNYANLVLMTHREFVHYADI